MSSEKELLKLLLPEYLVESIAMTKLAHWFRDVETLGFKSFSVLRKTIMNHYSDILNFFDRRSTNASA